MPNLIPGQVIQLSEPDLAALSTHVQNEITNLETKYAEYFKKLQVWWRWYDAIPRMEKKSWPFVGASNIVVPLIQIMADSLTARAFSSVFGAGDKVWMSRTENEKNERMSQDMARYVNWQGRGNDFDMRLVAYDTFSELYPIGETVIALNWRDDWRWLFVPGPRQGSFRKNVAKRVRFGRGPVLENSPRENYLWDTSHLIEDAPVVVRQMDHTWTRLKQMAMLQPGAWLMDNVDFVKGQSGHQGPGHNVTVEKKKLDNMSPVQLDHYTEPLDIREVHIDFPVLEEFGFSKRGAEELGTPDLPIVVTLHRNTGKILRVTAEPYNLPHKPFFGLHFRKRAGRGSGVGVAKRLFQMQSMMTTQFNQANDSVTRNNAVWAITSSKRHMESPLDPSHPIFAPGMEKEFAPFKLPPSVGPELGLIQAAQMMAERQMGIFDPALGRESRQGGHPSPATSTLALLENTDIMASPTMGMVRRSFSKIGEAIAILDQQFETNEDGKIERVLGEIDAAGASEFIFPTEPIPGNYQFDLVALSPRNNPDAEMQRAVQVGQMNQLYWTQVIQGAQVLDNPQVGERVKMAWLKYIDSTTNTYMKFLESANVDEIERFVLNLRQAQRGGAEDLRSAAGLAGGAGAAEGAGGQSPLGLLAGPNAGRAPTALAGA